MGAYDSQSTTPAEVVHKVRLVGGSSAVTKVTGTGPGVAVSRTGTGAYLLTWSENPGAFKDLTYGLQATTPGDLAGHTVVAGVYTSSGTSHTLAFVLYNASFAAHDLAALEWISLNLTFSLTTVSG